MFTSMLTGMFTSMRTCMLTGIYAFLFVSLYAFLDAHLLAYQCYQGLPMTQDMYVYTPVYLHSYLKAQWKNLKILCVLFSLTYEHVYMYVYTYVYGHFYIFTKITFVKTRYEENK